MIFKKNESVYLKNKIVNNNIKKNRYDFITKLLVNLDFGGFLKKIKKTIVLQNINSIAHPVRNA
tara:strand:- start:267 stop:458 length:192 start_codon:yes stop_codon:yes gene_type:complete